MPQQMCWMPRPYQARRLHGASFVCDLLRHWKAVGTYEASKRPRGSEGVPHVLAPWIRFTGWCMGHVEGEAPTKGCAVFMRVRTPAPHGSRLTAHCSYARVDGSWLSHALRARKGQRERAESQGATESETPCSVCPRDCVRLSRDMSGYERTLHLPSCRALRPRRASGRAKPVRGERAFPAAGAAYAVSFRARNP